MWSAPDSPAVVRSILSTPNKTPDSDKIPDICHVSHKSFFCHNSLITKGAIYIVVVATDYF